MEKRKQLTINLGAQHDQWLAICKKYNQKPASLVAAIIKSVIQDEISKPDGKQLASLLPKKDSKFYDQRLRLREDELQILDQYALIMGQTRHQALVGLVRAITVSEPQFTIGEIQQLDASNFELNKIGVNLNQIAHRTNTINFSNFTNSDVVALKQIIEKLIERTEKLTAFIENHTTKVWKLVNSARFRTDLKKKKIRS